MKHVSCMLCGADRPEILATKGKFGMRVTTVICTICGLVYTNPRMTDDEFEAYYASPAYRKQYSGMAEPDALLDERSLRGAEEKHAFLMKLMPSLPRARMLDIGCSAGYLPFVFARNGWQAQGIEPTVSFARYGSAKFGIRIDPVTLDTFATKERFSIITLIHVFEHFADPDGALQKIRRLLADDGIVYIEVPNVTEFYGRFWESCEAAHPYFYSVETLAAMLRRNGFGIHAMREGSALRVFAKKVPARRAVPHAYASTVQSIVRRERIYYTKGYVLFTPLYDRGHRILLRVLPAWCVARLKKIARIYARSRLPFARALEQLGAVEERARS